METRLLTHAKCPAEVSLFVLFVCLFQCLSSAADGVRLAARIVDTPCNEMNTDHFLEVSDYFSFPKCFDTNTAAFSAPYFNAACYRPSVLFQEIKTVGFELGITPVIIRGEELKQRGFGGTVFLDMYHILCLAN